MIEVSYNMQPDIANFIALSYNTLFVSTLLWFFFISILRLNFIFYKRQTTKQKNTKKTHELKVKLGFELDTYLPSRYIVIAMPCILLFVALIPLYHGSTLAEISRGVLGDLSITGLLVQVVLWVNYILPILLLDSKNQNLLLQAKLGKHLLQSRIFCLIIFALGLILYLATFNYISFDLYAMGYYPKYLLILIFILQLIFWHINKVFALIWLIALTAFYSKLQTSINLWDYMLDPVLWLLCSYALLFHPKNN
jgi:hypothetical protein